MIDPEEKAACIPAPVDPGKFNPKAELPYGLTVDHVRQAMEDFTDFLGFINAQILGKGIQRLERFLMPANFSSMVGEFMKAAIPKYCETLADNKFHNGHPDLIPAGQFPDNSVQYATDGIEVKGSRYASGWQGHNPESVWLMVFTFDNNTASKPDDPAIPFRFKGVYAAKLEHEDWNYSGRSETSRRTITAGVNKKGVAKMKANWIYIDSGDENSDEG